MERELTTEALVEAGFTLAGQWEVGADGNLSHPRDLPQAPGVYAFAIDGIVRYVGLASRSIRQRLTFYRKPGESQRTNVRLNGILREVIGAGNCVEVYVAHPPDATWNGLRISGPQGLEAGLIADFDLSWNMRGSAVALSAVATEREKPTSGVADRILEAVSRKPHMTEADIARAIFGPKAAQQRVNAHCRRMVEAGLLVRQGAGGAGDAYTYRVKP